ncbi:MAG: formylglycine-generating enzyme family protein [Planctomycetaceae bacterium]
MPCSAPSLFPSRSAGRFCAPLRLVHVGLLAVAAAYVATAPAHAVSIEWVTVGNAGNANSGVAYEYRIGMYEVTIRQYTDFLNAAAKTDPYGLYHVNMQTNVNVAGISRTGVPGAYEYSVMNNSGDSSNRPITYVSWFDAARFANWLHNGQGSGSTETGAYTLGGVTSGSTVAVNPHAQFYVPTDSEWIKAAYYSPLLNSGTGGFSTYATQSNANPGNSDSGGSNQANYNNGVYAVSQSSGYSSSQNYLMNVGTFASSSSYYGTFDQSGNVSEFTSPTIASMNVFLRGGDWGNDASRLSRAVTAISFPDSSLSTTGFRLASPVPVPEPTTWAMGVGGIICAGWGAFRRRPPRPRRPSCS